MKGEFMNIQDKTFREIGSMRYRDEMVEVLMKGSSKEIREFKNTAIAMSMAADEALDYKRERTLIRHKGLRKEKEKCLN